MCKEPFLCKLRLRPRGGTHQRKKGSWAHLERAVRNKMERQSFHLDPATVLKIVLEVFHRKELAKGLK